MVGQLVVEVDHAFLASGHPDSGGRVVVGLLGADHQGLDLVLDEVHTVFHLRAVLRVGRRNVGQLAGFGVDGDAPAVGHVLDVVPVALDVADLGLGGAGGAPDRLAFLGVAEQIVLYATGGAHSGIVAIALPRRGGHDVADLGGGASDSVGTVDGGLEHAVDGVGVPAVQVGERQRHRPPGSCVSDCSKPTSENLPELQVGPAHLFRCQLADRHRAAMSTDAREMTTNLAPKSMSRPTRRRTRKCRRSGGAGRLG
jgi:hypothetical protein